MRVWKKDYIKGYVDIACRIIDMGLLTDEQIATVTHHELGDIEALRRSLIRERENMLLSLIKSDELDDEQIAAITKQTTKRVIALRHCVRLERARMLQALISLGSLTDSEISSLIDCSIDEIEDLQQELEAQKSNTKEA